MDRDLEIPYSYMHTMSSVAYPHVNIPVVYTRNYLFVELERERGELYDISTDRGTGIGAPDNIIS